MRTLILSTAVRKQYFLLRKHDLLPSACSYIHMIILRNGLKAQIKVFYNIKLRGLTVWLVMKVCNSASCYLLLLLYDTEKKVCEESGVLGLSISEHWIPSS